MTHMNNYINSLKSFYLNHPGKRRLLISLLITVLLLIIIRAALPHTIIYNANSWLKQQGIESTIADIKINILDGSFSLIDAKGYRNNNLLFDIGLIDIHWHWKPLSKKTIAITRVALDKLSINIKKYQDMIVVGGIQVAPQQDNKAAIDQTQEGASWAASLGEISFTNLNICYLQYSETFSKGKEKPAEIDYCAALQEASWNGTVSYDTRIKQVDSKDLSLSSQGDFKLLGLTLTDNKLNKNLLDLKANNITNIAISGTNNIHIDQVLFNDFSALQRNDKTNADTVHFQQLILGNLNLTDLNSLSIDDIKLNKPGLYLVKNSPELWEYQQWIPTLPTSTSKDDSQTKSSASPLTVSINNISIHDSDSCYQDISSSQLYCFKFDTFEWNGNVKYASSHTTNELNLLAHGDITFLQPNVRDQVINRNLVNFHSLILTEFQLNGINNVTFNTLKLDKLSALQRGEADDDATISIDSFDITKASLSDNSISLNSINILGIANKISKNKDGSWEHDKWLKNIPAKENKADPLADSEVGNKRNLVFSINKLNIVSDKDITYIDNSTDPVMKTGLQAFSFDLTKLNSALPDTDTHFTLSAKTDHHSTIDIKGIARPFADKISFNADGKLNGFDLRTASPVTKQAIGHIIKSGQMNADLKLLAVDGKLDSNIALSLYQFNIQSMNKDSADKLDKLFGMPLNQTLVLLRDKDDSINLDIPITGDVTSPDFNPMDAIIKATSKAATVTLVTFYTPYGLIYAGGNVLFDLATALNFEPVIFNAGISVLQDNNKQQLEKLTRLLTEKPNIRLTLCGMTNRNDLYALYPELKKDSSVKDIAIKLTKIHSEALEKLATERQVNSKDYLIKQLKVSHDRLILCAPEHSNKDNAISGVEINI